MAEPLFWHTPDGVRLHALDYPATGADGRLPVICLHGLTRNARDFEELAPWLAGRGHRVLALDMRGRGRSGWDPEARYTVPTYAGDVAGLMAANGIERALFVGTSMGGLVTMELAARRPELIAGAVINDVGPVLGEAGLTRIAAYVGKPVAIGSWAEAEEYVRHQNEAAFPDYGPEEWARMARRLCREHDGVVAPDYDLAIARPFADGARPREPWAAWDALAAAAPVLLVRGETSDILEPWVAARMIGGQPNVAFVEVAGVGHAPMLDEPEAQAAIAGFAGLF